MCRNIRVLHYFDPPTTPEEVDAAALQYVRKVSGSTRPSQANQAAFDAAVEAIAAITTQLLSDLEPRGEPRTREGELAKARARWDKRTGKPASRSSTTFAPPASTSAGMYATAQPGSDRQAQAVPSYMP